MKKEVDMIFPPLSNGSQWDEHFNDLSYWKPVPDHLKETKDLILI